MKFSEATGMTRADADAIYAYVMRLRPMKVANPKTELDFPFNIRLGMLGWNLLFLHDSLPAVSRRAVTGLAARAIPGQRAGALRRMPYAARHRGRDCAVAIVDRVRARPRRRARHHAGGFGGARLDRRGIACVPGLRDCAARLLGLSLGYPADAISRGEAFEHEGTMSQ